MLYYGFRYGSKLSPLPPLLKNQTWPFLSVTSQVKGKRTATRLLLLLIRIQRALPGKEVATMLSGNIVVPDISHGSNVLGIIKSFYLWLHKIMVFLSVTTFLLPGRVSSLYLKILAICLDQNS